MLLIIKNFFKKIVLVIMQCNVKKMFGQESKSYKRFPTASKHNDLQLYPFLILLYTFS